MKHSRLVLLTIILVLIALILASLYFKGTSESIVRTLSPVMTMKYNEKVVDSGDAITFTGVLKNEKILLNQGKWSKSFRGHFSLNGIQYTFNTMYVGRSTYETFTGPLTWLEYGKEQISIITFKKDLTAFQFSKPDGQLINGPSANIKEWHRQFSFFTSTEMK